MAVKEENGKAGSSHSDTDRAIRSFHKPDREVGKKIGYQHLFLRKSDWGYRSLMLTNDRLLPEVSKGGSELLVSSRSAALARKCFSTGRVAHCRQQPTTAF